MVIQFSEVIKQGAATMVLGVENPTLNGVNAGIGTFGIDTENNYWVKVDIGDTNWEKLSYGEPEPIFNENSNVRINNNNFQIKDVTGNGWRTIWFENGVLKVGTLEQ
jgi:hypothetical protein